MGMLENFRDMVECNQLDYGNEKEKCDEIEFWLELIESVQKGITIMFSGKDAKIMNAKKYNEYLEREDIEEPISKKMLMAENEELKKENVKFLQKCKKWAELLKIDGGNTKHQVLVDLEKFIEYSNIKENNELEGENK